jgi:hypothetical protein
MKRKYFVGLIQDEKINITECKIFAEDSDEAYKKLTNYIEQNASNVFQFKITGWWIIDEDDMIIIE